MPDVASILISGYYGYANPGDEAILAVLLSELRGKFPGAGIRVVSGSPEETARSHQVEAVLWSDPLAIAKAVEASDFVVTGGGGIFHDYGGFPEYGLLTEGNWGLGFHVTAGVLANLLGKPHFIYAVGVGPLFSDHGRRYARAICDAATAITVRDEASRDLLAEVGCDPQRIAVTADPVFLFTPAPPERLAEILGNEAIPPSGKRILAVARPWSHEVDHTQWEIELAAGLDDFCRNEPEAQVVLMPFQRFPGEQEDDLPVAERIHALLQHKDRSYVVRGRFSPAEQAALIGSSQLVVGMRLHSVIFAMSARVPFVALTYDTKVEEVIRRAGKQHLGIAMTELRGAGLAGRMHAALAEPTADPGPLREAAGRNLESINPTTPPPTGAAGYLIQTAVRSLLESSHQLRFWLRDQKINYEYQVRVGEEQIAGLGSSIDTLRREAEQTKAELTAELAAERSLHQQHLDAAEELAVELKRQLDELEAMVVQQGAALRSTQSSLQDTRQRLLDRESELRQVTGDLGELTERHRVTVTEWDAYSEDLNRRLGIYRSQRAWHAMLALRKGYVVFTRLGLFAFAGWCLKLLGGNGQIETEQLEFPPRPRVR